MTKVQLVASPEMPEPRAQHAPTAVYRLYAIDGIPLYIGVTGDPERRFKQHRDTKPWWPQVARKTIEWHPSRDRALAEEAAAIEAETPVYNIDHNPAAASYHWPPAGMPADRVETIERVASTLPADDAEGIRRAAFDGFTQGQLAAVDPEAQRATAAFKALTADLQVEEWDPSTLPEKLRAKFYAFYLEHKDGTRLIVVPTGQDPVIRLHAVRAILAHPGVTA